MAGGTFKKNPATGKFIKLPDGKFARCTCCGDYALAEPCGDDYEGENVYFSPGKAPPCAYMEAVGTGNRCFKISNTFEPYTPGEGDIYLDIGAPGNPLQFDNCCDCDDATCEDLRTSTLLSKICPTGGTALPSFPGCCCVAEGTEVTGTGTAVEHQWRNSSATIREIIRTFTWSWSFTYGSPGSFTGTWTRVTENLTHVGGGVYEWQTTTVGPTPFTPTEEACPLFVEEPQVDAQANQAYTCGGGVGITQSYTEEQDCHNYHGTAERMVGNADHACSPVLVCGQYNSWEVTVSAVDPGVPSRCLGGCDE